MSVSWRDCEVLVDHRRATTGCRCDQFSGICRDVYIKLTKPHPTAMRLHCFRWLKKTVEKQNLQILRIALMCHWKFPRVVFVKLLTLWLLCNPLKKTFHLLLGCKQSGVCIHFCSDGVKWQPNANVNLVNIAESNQLCSWNLVLCFCSWVTPPENSSVTLCLITVLSYQPVEFSRKTLSAPLSPQTFTQNGGNEPSLYFLCGTSI